MTAPDPTALHEEAMTLCDQARAILARALDLERQAIALSPTQPSHAILSRSAIMIALNAGDLDAARQIGAAALAHPDLVQAPAHHVADLIDAIALIGHYTTL